MTQGTPIADTDVVRFRFSKGLKNFYAPDCVLGFKRYMPYLRPHTAFSPLRQRNASLTAVKMASQIPRQLT